MNTYKLGVIGAGNMGMAIARGMVQAGTPAHQILLFNRSAEKRQAHQAEGFSVTDDYGALYETSETVLLAVKPQNFDEVLGRLAQCSRSQHPLVLSVAAGITFARMEQTLGADCPIIRVMPNTPLMIGEGATQLVKNAAASDMQLAQVRALFDTMGVTAVFTEEDKLNDVIPFAGSAPAYIYTLTDCMVRSAESYGIPREDALRLFCQALIGSAKMMLQGEKTPAELTQAVCSPGGATLEAMKVLEERDLDGILRQANEKCIVRAYELGK